MQFVHVEAHLMADVQLGIANLPKHIWWPFRS
jgi:hypothetical protein